MEGKVVDQVSGSPLKKTALTLRPNGTGKTVATETDEQGRFSFPKVEPGTYWLIGQRVGYAQQYYNGHSGTSYGAVLPLEPGNEVKNLVFKLIPNVLISGKVLDEDGDPIARATVTALRYMYRTSGRQLQSAEAAQTGANGEYSMSVPPGRYVLMAVSTATMMQGLNAQAAKPASDAPEMAYTTTFYPNSTDESGASASEATAGQELRGMDFHMVKVKTYRVRGKVPESTTAISMLQLVPQGSSQTARYAPRMTQVQSDKSFEFVGVVPGSYNLMSNGPGGVNITRQPITVDDRHIEGLVPVLTPMGQLTGTVAIEGQDTPNSPQGTPTTPPGSQTTSGPGVTPPGSVAGIMVGFDSYDNGTNPSAITKEDGKFSIGYILPGRYHPWVGYPPKGGYAKAIRYDGRDIKDEALDITEGITGPVEVVMSLNGADVSGVVVDEDGNPFPGATVMLIPNSGAYLMHYSSNTDYQGQFHFTMAIRPGDFKVLALEDAIYLAWFDKEFMKPYMGKSTNLSVSENDKKTLALKVVRLM